ncbi:MAG: hypothetical protein AVDCRST_MAG64-1731 [uncultured Phycisphaerae bacterium]|uniref:FAD-binding domain-containing protein n=1 Tax=uncultured Phycisphaerae bacterium TaxID=904963 RepID=A0A6J4NYT5_9BACT|nr:MAG: hypothetical protein AVDCRST_MAG64-1731 [uncultured Phycisphaerae bacterium]
MPDVTIIGAGPGGSTAGILLARAGWDVTLVEQSRFPRDKVCGECLSALGFDVLTRLGLAGAFARLGAVRLDRAEVHAPSGRSLVAELPRPMWGLTRRSLDTLLLDAARDAGAVVRQPVRCESVITADGDESVGRTHAVNADQRGARSGESSQAARAAQRSPGSAAHAVPTDPGLRCAPHPACQGNSPPEPPRPLVRLRDLTTNVVETLAPSHVILADGKAAFASDPPAPTGDFGIKTHFEHVDGPRDRIELFGVRGSYGGLAAVEGGRWNAAFSAPAARLKAARGGVDALFAAMASENATLARRLARARRVGPWLASPLPRFPVRRHWPPHVTPVGNAAAALEPIGGEGMGLAMRSAELTSLGLIAGSAGGDALPCEPWELRGAYRRLWRVRRVACRAAALAASSPGVAGILPLARPPAPVLRAVLRLMGKTAG